MIKLFIVDDHSLFRQGLIEIFKTKKQFKVIGEAEDGRGCLTFCKKNKPDIILMDISLPGKSGLKVTGEIISANPKQKVIILSMYDDERHIFEAFQNGAVGYFVKSKSVDELFKIITTVDKEGSAVPRVITNKLLSGLRKFAQPQDRFKLTAKETEVLKLLKKGISNKEIAGPISTSEKTIKNHLASIFQKLAVENRTQAVVKAIEEKII